MLIKNVIALIFTVTFCTSLLAQNKPSLSAEKGPIFKRYGPVFKVADRDIALATNFNYKVFFDITKTSDSLTQHNRAIESVARFINMHALNGVKLEDMEIAVVLHGQATRDALNHQAHQKRYGKDNPSLDLVKQLAEKGVTFYLCGQSLSFSGQQKSDLASPIKLALSAMTTSTQLQHQGFSLIP